MTFKIGSLFDGISGFPLAALRAGMLPVWASEIEPFPIKVSAYHFPGMKQLGDVTKINGAGIEPVDIITFGSPCQDLSVAGKREGMKYECCDCGHKWEHDIKNGLPNFCPQCASENIKNTRSGLFMQAVKIIRKMREATNGHYPRFAVWENVPGAFSSNKGRDFRAVISELAGCEVPMPTDNQWANAGMVRRNGCSLAWRVLDAQYWGVPQRRRRIFLVTDFRGQSAPEILFEQESVSGNIAESERQGQRTAGSVEGCAGTTECITIASKQISQNIGYDVAMPLMANDYKEPQCVMSPTIGFRGDRNGLDSVNDKTPTLTSCDGAGNGCKMAVAFPKVANPLLSKANMSYRMDMDNVVVQSAGFCPEQSEKTHGIGYEEEISPTLRAGAGAPKHEADENGRLVIHPKVTGTLCASGAGLSRPAGMGSETDLVVATVDCRNLNETQELSGTLQSKTTGGYSLNYQNPVRIGYAVRRLTPLECERLQGFPDGWTDIPGASDTARYKALGNSVAIPCVQFVMDGISRELNKSESS